MRNNITKEMAHREMDARRELLEKRRKIMEEIFTQAAERLKEFAQSQEYQDWMKRHCQKLAETFSQPGTVLFVRPEDRKLESLLKSAFGTACEVQEDEEIHLGGIRAQNLAMGLVADDTLDALLENQQEWFEENSGLQVQ